jgi:hypothetical protein
MARRADFRNLTTFALKEHWMIDIGFIGLGTMGRPMGGHLLAAGHQLVVAGTIRRW